MNISRPKKKKIILILIIIGTRAMQDLDNNADNKPYELLLNDLVRVPACMDVAEENWGSCEQSIWNAVEAIDTMLEHYTEENITEQMIEDCNTTLAAALP